MEKLNLKEMVLYSQTVPDVMNGMPNFISMRGALDVTVPRGKPLPDRLYQVTSNVETALVRAFPNLCFVGKENANEIDTKYPGVRYLGEIYGANEQGAITKMTMSGHETRGLELETLLTFFSVFPLGEHQMQTRKALSEIWPYIQGFDFVFPGGNIIPYEKQGNQSILLVRAGNPIASGEHAIREAELPLVLKKPILMTNGIRI